MIEPAAASFEPYAEEYDRARPSWPDAAVEQGDLPRESTVPSSFTCAAGHTGPSADRFACA